VWVPRGGGQMEIVGHEPALLYKSDDDAVQKISATMASASEQQRLREKLASISEQFSTARFMQQVRTIVNEFEG
jgi:hypothetical protein